MEHSHQVTSKDNLEANPAYATSQPSSQDPSPTWKMTTTEPSGSMRVPSPPTYYPPMQLPCRVVMAYWPDQDQGHIFTRGLHEHGFSELFAQNVPRSRSSVVVKNMYFLAHRMVYQRIPVLSGHRSTDHDYRVELVGITYGPWRHQIVYECMDGHAMPLPRQQQLRILALHPCYQDAEEWGSFPPAPEGQRTRRNQLLGAALFRGTNNVMPTPLNTDDIEYLVRNIAHFCQLLQVRSPREFVRMLPPHLASMVYAHLCSVQTMTPSAASRPVPPVADKELSEPHCTTSTTTSSHSCQSPPLASAPAVEDSEETAHKDSRGEAIANVPSLSPLRNECPSAMSANAAFHLQSDVDCKSSLPVASLEHQSVDRTLDKTASVGKAINATIPAPASPTRKRLNKRKISPCKKRNVTKKASPKGKESGSTNKRSNRSNKENSINDSHSSSPAVDAETYPLQQNIMHKSVKQEKLGAPRGHSNSSINNSCINDDAGGSPAVCSEKDSLQQFLMKTSVKEGNSQLQQQEQQPCSRTADTPRTPAICNFRSESHWI